MFPYLATGVWLDKDHSNMPASRSPPFVQIKDLSLDKIRNYQVGLKLVLFVSESAAKQTAVSPRCQFHQHFMSSFCAKTLSPKNYKPKL
jgi:hypothetical protein